MDLFTSFSNAFWSESFWIEGNVTWSELEDARSSGRAWVALPRDLLVSLPLAVVLFILRLAWERLVARPIGRRFHISERAPPRARHNVTLEAAYRKFGKHPPGEYVLEGIGKQADWSVQHVQRWWRRRRLQDKPPCMIKFTETSWRCFFYFVAWCYGVAVLWDEGYVFDTRRTWDGYPFQSVPDTIYWYYMVELGFYWSLVLSLFMDHKRKDFVENIVHHIATIGLMSFSWSNGTCRWGAIVLVIHDTCDYWMEGAKLALYMKVQWLCDTLFVIFAVLWFITRLVIYPWKMIYNSYYESLEIIGHTTNGWVVFYGLLITLQVLHVIWFCMIMRMVYRYVIVGIIEKDDRSETEPDTNSDDESVLDARRDASDARHYDVRRRKMTANNNTDTTS